MSTKAARGTKRNCQNGTCALPFYDLNRDAFACPNCGTPFDLALLARLKAEQSEKNYPRRVGRVYPQHLVVADKAPAEAAEIEDVEVEVEEDADTADTDVILETEDEADATPDFSPPAKGGNEE